jgi:hypothetical protein
MIDFFIIFVLGHLPFTIFVILVLIGQLMIWWERIFKNEKR